ncbi:unnamed protein product [Sympodiomycopsis kandeliae]
MIFTSQAPPVDHFPDDLDLYTFMFEYFPSYRFRPQGTGLPLLIDEETGQSWTFEDTKYRIDLLAVGLREKLGIQDGTVVAIFSANCVDYLVAILACHKVGAIVSCANPAFQPSELSYQLEASKATAMFVGEEATDAGLNAARKAGIPTDRVLIMQTPKTCQAQGALRGGPSRIESGAWTLEGLAAEGREQFKLKGPSAFAEGRVLLSPGQSKKKLAFLSFSSGTTGLPKGVMIQHSAPCNNILQQYAFNDITNPAKSDSRFRPGIDRSLGGLPFFHIYGLVVGLLFTFFAGLPNVAIPKFRGIEQMIKTALKYQVSIWWLVPPQVVLLVKDPSVAPYVSQIQKLVRFIMIGAAPLSDDLSTQLERLFPTIGAPQGSGMTELSTVITMHPIGMKPVSGSAGRLFPNVEARVVTPEGKDCGIDESGELWIRGPTNTLGYLNNQKATEEMWVPGGWVRTGDEVKFNKDGDMFIVDRLKELIKVKGFQVAPAELEGWILNHDAVGDVGVIGYPDESAGEIPLAFVSLAEDTKKRLSTLSDTERQKDEENIKASVMKFVADNKVRYKHLGGVVIIEAIPKTASGKILRRTLREMGKKLPPLKKQSQSKL